MPLPGPLALTGRGAGPGSSLPLAPAMDLLPPKPKYNPLRNESLSSLEEGASGSTPPEELPSPSASSLGPILPPLPGDDSPTTLCSFFPRMSNLKLANPAGGRLGPKAEPGRAAEDREGTTGAGVPDSGPLPLLQDMNKLSGGGGRRTRVEGGQLGGEEWTRHGSFVNKPTRGWLHPNDKVMGPGVSYLVRVSEHRPSGALPVPCHSSFGGVSVALFPSSSLRFSALFLIPVAPLILQPLPSQLCLDPTSSLRLPRPTPTPPCLAGCPARGRSSLLE